MEVGCKARKQIKFMKLTQKDLKDLWGEDGPYSQAHLLVEERILDDSLSRTFVYVQAVLNPFTFRFIKKYVKHFAKDTLVLLIMKRAIYKGPADGFVATVHGDEMIDEKDRKNAEKILKETRQAIIRMHQYVMDSFANKTVN
jgi:hypothetical protein